MGDTIKKYCIDVHIHVSQFILARISPFMTFLANKCHKHYYYVVIY